MATAGFTVAGMTAGSRSRLLSATGMAVSTVGVAVARQVGWAGLRQRPDDGRGQIGGRGPWRCAFRGMRELAVAGADGACRHAIHINQRDAQSRHQGNAAEGELGQVAHHERRHPQQRAGGINQLRAAPVAWHGKSQLPFCSEGHVVGYARIRIAERGVSLIDARRDGVASCIRGCLPVRMKKAHQQPVVFLDFFRGSNGIDAENTVMIGTVRHQDLFDEKPGGLLLLPGNVVGRRAGGFAEGIARRHLQQCSHADRKASVPVQQVGKPAGGAREGKRQRKAVVAGLVRTHAGKRFWSVSPY